MVSISNSFTTIISRRNFDGKRPLQTTFIVFRFRHFFATVAHSNSESELYSFFYFIKKNNCGINCSYSKQSIANIIRFWMPLFMRFYFLHIIVTRVDLMINPNKSAFKFGPSLVHTIDMRNESICLTMNLNPIIATSCQFSNWSFSIIFQGRIIFDINMWIRIFFMTEIYSKKRTVTV